MCALYSLEMLQAGAVKGLNPKCTVSDLHCITTANTGYGMVAKWQVIGLWMRRKKAQFLVQAASNITFTPRLLMLSSPSGEMKI